MVDGDNNRGLKDGFWDNVGSVVAALGGAVLTVFGGKLVEVAAKGGRADRVLARVQGIGMHSSKFMNSAEATTAKTALTDSVSSFSKFRGATIDAFKNSMNPAREGDSMKQIFTSGIKNSFTPAGLGNAELAQAWKLGLRHPSLLDTKLVLSGLGVTALQGGKDTLKILSQRSEPTPGHLPGGVGEVSKFPGMPEDFGKVAGIPDAVAKTGDVIRHFTHIR